MVLLDFEVNHGGVMHTVPDYYYEGGEVSFLHSISSEKLTFADLDLMIKKLCGPSVSKYHYRVPGLTLDRGLRLVWENAIPCIISLSETHKCYIQIYVEHEFGNEDEELHNNDNEDSDDDVNSLEHVSEDEDDELIYYTKKKLEAAEANRKGKSKCVEGVEVNEDDKGSEDDLDCYDSECDEGRVEGDENIKDNVGETEGGENIEVDVGENDEGGTHNDAKDGYVSEYLETDDEAGYGTPEYDSDDEDFIAASREQKWSVFDPSTKWDDQEPRKGMIFKDCFQLKHCITNYGVAKGRTIKFPKMCKNVVLAKCAKPGCKWRLYASTKQMDNAIQVKSYFRHHSRKVCQFNHKVGMVNSRWLASEYATELRKDPKWKLSSFMKAVQEKHKINVTKMQCSRARRFAITEVESVLIEHYAKLWKYRDELLRSNPGSTVVLEGKEIIPSSPHVFDKFYICFNALKKGWLAGCRPVIGLDGCFLKSVCKNQLLCAVGRDGNNHMFPIAWAVVESESTETWTWFLKLLNEDIGNGFEHGLGLTCISDQQKGLLHAIKDVFPLAEERNCARHIYANFRKHFSGHTLRNLFWLAAKSSTEAEFWEKMDQIKKVSIPAYEYLKDSGIKHWVRGFFATWSCCDSVENNLSETFNSYILQAREKPIIEMLEEIRQAIMGRLIEKKEFYLKYEDYLCPKVRKKLELAKSEYRHWDVSRNGCGGFEVRKGLFGYAVDLVERSCACRMWQLGGIPCEHAVAAIAFSNDDCDAFVNHWLTVEKSSKAYQFPLLPVNGENLWPQSDMVPLMPPPRRRNRGRPRTMRYKEWAERRGRSGKGSTETEKKQKANPSEIERTGRQMRCTNCNEWGHNARKCGNPRVEGDKDLDKRRKSQRKKKPDSDNVEQTARRGSKRGRGDNGNVRQECETSAQGEKRGKAAARRVNLANEREALNKGGGLLPGEISPGVYKGKRTKAAARRVNIGNVNDVSGNLDSIGPNRKRPRKFAQVMELINEEHLESQETLGNSGPQNDNGDNMASKKSIVMDMYQYGLLKLDYIASNQKFKTVSDIIDTNSVEQSYVEEEINLSAPQPSQKSNEPVVEDVPALTVPIVKKGKKNKKKAEIDVKKRSSPRAVLSRWKLTGRRYKEKNEGVVQID